MDLCTQDGCSNKLHRQGLCQKHLNCRPKTNEEPTPILCSMCERPHYARGYCQRHYWTEIRAPNTKRRGEGDGIYEIEFNLKRANQAYENVIGVFNQMNWARIIRDLEHDAEIAREEAIQRDSASNLQVQQNKEAS